MALRTDGRNSAILEHFSYKPMRRLLTVLYSNPPAAYAKSLGGRKYLIMLKSHMDAKENALVAISQIPENSGHSLHRGTPREAFIREFLEAHLPENVAIGAGEIIDCSFIS